MVLGKSKNPFVSSPNFVSQYQRMGRKEPIPNHWFFEFFFKTPGGLGFRV
jgi:hypothetical protein